MSAAVSQRELTVVCFAAMALRTWLAHIANEPPGLGVFSHEHTGPVAYNYLLL